MKNILQERKPLMIVEYIQAALARATFEIIEDKEPYYGEVPDLPGVWATGKILEECRANLANVIDSWIVVHLRKGLPIPRLGDFTIEDIAGMDAGNRI
jgi:predicted RNase H-like HicB family nuclease